MAVCPPLERHPVLWLDLAHPPLQSTAKSSFVITRIHSITWSSLQTAHALSKLVQILWFIWLEASPPLPKSWLSHFRINRLLFAIKYICVYNAFFGGLTWHLSTLQSFLSAALIALAEGEAWPNVFCKDKMYSTKLRTHCELSHLIY